MDSCQLMRKETKMDVVHLNQKQLAARWSISEATLERWRSVGIGPKFLELCGRVMAPRTKRLLKVRNRSAAGCREPVRTPSKSLPDCRPASRFFSHAGRRERASNSSAIGGWFNSQTRNRTRVRMVVQTEGSATASLSAAGSVSLRIVRAQRCSIKVLI